jgi:hypothetical protein
MENVPSRIRKKININSHALHTKNAATVFNSTISTGLRKVFFHITRQNKTVKPAVIRKLSK